MKARVSLVCPAPVDAGGGIRDGGGKRKCKSGVRGGGWRHSSAPLPSVAALHCAIRPSALWGIVMSTWHLGLQPLFRIRLQGTGLTFCAAVRRLQTTSVTQTALIWHFFKKSAPFCLFFRQKSGSGRLSCGSALCCARMTPASPELPGRRLLVPFATVHTKDALGAAVCCGPCRARPGPWELGARAGAAGLHKAVRGLSGWGWRH